MLIPSAQAVNAAGILAAYDLLKEVKPYAPVAANTGRETWFDGSAAIVCTDAGTWNEVWNRHIQNQQIGNVGVGNLNPPPNVDFTKNVLVALFAGPTRGVVGYQVDRGILLGQDAWLHLRPVLDPSAGNSVALPSPWAFIVLPRTHASVSIQIPGAKGWNTVVKVPPSAGS